MRALIALTAFISCSAVNGSIQLAR